ncbi:uncharacterized protein DUF4386 [Prauserella shujinwangii]|uniref:Uncharacterized protein DUF4386 n=1 Tax=Prauserella shujinwangii TaxID=1453103 RepID=A0A2T0LPJ0_9PSEU|nr:DUF4386 domain-containing protein [Prauserella shujinwangii]PRX45086.1 uncharacterized protein DUF4386 [Prauserella shujinwangii]
MTAPAGVPGGRTGPAPRTLARIAGVLYLAVAVLTVFAGLVNRHLAEAGGAGAPLTLFRLGFVSELGGAIAFLATGMALYLLFEHVDRRVAAVMVTFVAVSVAMQSLNLLNHYAVLTVAGGQGPAGAFGPAAADRLTALFADLYHHGYLIAQTYFGLWLLPLAYLVVRSGYLPRVLGVLLVIGCTGHLTDVCTRFLAPALGATISPFAMTPAAIAELAFIGWLLIKAVRVAEPGIPTRYGAPA